VRTVLGSGLLLIASLLASPVAFAAQRFPPPEFETGYVMPLTQTPPARSVFLEYLDVGLLLVALGLAAYLALKRRSRKWLVALSVFCVIYFGFVRAGCICPIGAPQNVALALFNADYALPLTVLAFFLAPLVVSLFAGRVFCAAVCPHGALQDLVLVKPVKVPLWLEHGLSTLPYLFLGAGLIFAATGSAFIICRYDPFVPLFRLSGDLVILLVGVGLLVVGMFVGRPYCRFLCPYGALLRLGALVSKWRIRVTPDYCTQCRLCEDSCPFGAMREPALAAADHATRAADRRRLGWLLLLLPVLIFGGAWLGGTLGTTLSKLDADVALAETFLDPNRPPPEPGVQTPEDLALARAEKEADTLLASAMQVRGRFDLAGWLFGGWAGLVIGAKLIGLSLRQARTDYEPDRGACIGCGRCYLYCPNERVRLGLMPASELPPMPQPGPNAPEEGATETVPHSGSPAEEGSRSSIAKAG
jgi:polyferredoxin